MVKRLIGIDIQYARQYPIMSENVFLYMENFAVAVVVVVHDMETTLLSVKGFIFFTYTKHSWALSSESYLASNNYLDTRFCLFDHL